MKYIMNMEPNKFPKLIYLDQNIWVELEKVEFQVKQDEEIKYILTMLRSLLSLNKIILPIDINRLIETSHRSISVTRNRMSELMIELSKGYAILPYLFVEELEIRNYINRKLGLNEVNLIELLVNQNFENLLAGTPKLVGNQLSKELQKINKEIQRITSTNDFKTRIISIHTARNADLEQKQVINAENARSALKSMATDRERRDYLINVDFGSLLRKIMETYKLTDNHEGKLSDIEELGNLIMIRNSLPFPLHSIRDRVAFMQEFPLYYTHRTLVSFRDRNIDRPIRSNDIIDIMGYVVPIVYFDFIVGEKYFMTLAHQAKLDILYNATLSRKLSELKPYLESLLNE